MKLYMCVSVRACVCVCVCVCLWCVCVCVCVEYTYDIWYYMIRYMIWYMIYDRIWYMIYVIYDMIYDIYDMIYDTWYDIFVKCNWVVTRWQQYSTHLQTNNTMYTDIKQKIHRTTQKVWKSARRVPSLRVIPWHLPYNWGKSTNKPQSG
jgi:hypothetical protein